jgi:hypothetical protein
MREYSVENGVAEVIAALGVGLAGELDFADQVSSVESAPYCDNYGGSQVITMDGIVWTMKDGRRIRFGESVDEYAFIIVKTPEAWKHAEDELGGDAEAGDLMLFEMDGEGVFHDGLPGGYGMEDASFYDLFRLRAAYTPNAIRALILSAVNGEITSGI